jgi:ribose transport system permease protein
VNRTTLQAIWRDYTTILVLIGLCAVLSGLTLQEQSPVGSFGGRQLAQLIRRQAPRGASVLIVAGSSAEDAAFAAAADKQLGADGFRVVATVRGNPLDAKRAINQATTAGAKIDILAAEEKTARWDVLQDLSWADPRARDARLFYPQSRRWPTFLNGANLLNIANRIVVIAVIAIGMTMVIIAGGIDLSVGSLVALSAVICARLIHDRSAAGHAGAVTLLMGIFAAIGVAAAVGAWNGAFVSYFRIPSFIVTLATMLAADGLAFIVTRGETVSTQPASIGWLMGGSSLLGIRNGIVLMLALYAIGHVVLSRSVFGRYLYAVGGNRKAAWLCGLPVRRVELASYIISGALAGLGGVLMVSEYESGAPIYGKAYELQVIAAVVVGGTSLAGGQGRMFGTLLGALLIAVVQNGMNLMGISSNPQKVVLGLVILAAAVIDRLKQRRSDQ